MSVEGTPLTRSLVKRARTPSPIATQDGQQTVAILFLAHDGVTNPDLWERWRSSCENYAERISFHVFRNQNILYDSEFADRYDLGLRMRTRWCSSSIVHATIKSLKQILEQDKAVGIVYLVSGMDIPVQPPERLFQARHVVTEGQSCRIVPFKTVIAYDPDGELKRCEGWKKTEEDIRQHVENHVQWCALSRHHAELLISYPSLTRLLRIGDRLSDFWCPDEWLLGTILSLLGVPKSEVIDWPITDQYRQRKRDRSPVLWPDLHRTKRQVFWAPPSFFRTFTMAKVIQCTRAEGNLFFRKVGRLTPEEIDELLELSDPPPPPPEPQRFDGWSAPLTRRARRELGVDGLEDTPVSPTPMVLASSSRPDAKERREEDDNNRSASNLLSDLEGENDSLPPRRGSMRGGCGEGCEC